MAEFFEVLCAAVGLLVFVCLTRAAWELGPSVATLIGARWLPKGSVKIVDGIGGGREWTTLEAPDGRILWAGPRENTQTGERG